MRALTALALVLASVSAGCGKRGDPLPPLLRIPTPVNSPRVSQQGQEIVITWATPTATVDGGVLELSEAEVLRRVVEPTPEPPPDAPPGIPFEEGGAMSGETAPADSSVEAEPSPEEVENETVASEDVPSEETAQEEQMDEDAPGVALPSFAIPRQESFASEAKVIARLECHEPGERLEYRDSWDPEWEGMRVEYAVRHVNSRGRRSENSNRSSIAPLPPLPAPAELEAVADNGFVRLAWSGSPEPGVPVPETTGAEVEPRAATQPETQAETEPEPQPTTEPTEPAPQVDYGYNVYRRRKGAESYAARALNRQLLETTGFEDQDVAFGRDWCYTVRRVAVRRALEPAEPADDLPSSDDAAVLGGATPPAEEAASENMRARRRGAPGEGGRQAVQPPALIESGNADEVCLTPVDTFAPAVPQDVLALGVPGGILLSWSESEASDLQGYRVYRAGRRNGTFELLTPELLDVPSFTDRDASPGRSYFYTVSALDRAQPPNESPRSEVVGAAAPE